MDVSGTWIRRAIRWVQPTQFILLLTVCFSRLPSAQAQTSRRPTAAPVAAPISTVAIEPPSTPLAFNSPNTTNLDEKARLRARALFDQGARAYNESRYFQAAAYFLDAYRVYPTPQLLFNVAKAHDKLAVPSSALAYYRDYLRKLPDAPDAADVGNRVRELEAALAQRGIQQLSVLTSPPRALVAVDGVAVGITPWTGETWPGEHRLTVTLDGHEATTTLITVDPLRAQDFSYELAKLDAPGTAGHSASNAATRSSTRVSTLTWLALGTATAAFGATLAAEMAAKNTSGLTRTGAFFGGIGIASSVFGGVLLYLDLYAPNATPTQKNHAFVAGVSGRF